MSHKNTQCDLETKIPQRILSASGITIEGNPVELLTNDAGSSSNSAGYDATSTPTMLAQSSVEGGDTATQVEESNEKPHLSEPERSDAAIQCELLPEVGQPLSNFVCIILYPQRMSDETRNVGTQYQSADFDVTATQPKRYYRTRDVSTQHEENYGKKQISVTVDVNTNQPKKPKGTKDAATQNEGTKDAATQCKETVEKGQKRSETIKAITKQPKTSDGTKEAATQYEAQNKGTAKKSCCCFDNFLNFIS